MKVKQAMFSPDIIHLRQFYATPMGQSVRALIAASIRRFWPSAPGEALLAFGYATPYLSHYRQDAESIAACMPAQQGAEYFPRDGDNIVLLAHDSELPFAESSANRALLVHSVENSEQLSWIIQEIWRVLTPGGRVLAVVPNRFSLWSRSSKSPFGYGRPFSMAQLRDLFNGHQFAIIRCSTGLFMPPVRLRWFWKAATKLENICVRLCDTLGCHMGGVLLIEVEKQLYSPLREPVVAGRAYRSSMAPRPAMTADLPPSL